jgi:hypothetical protein
LWAQHRNVIASMAQKAGLNCIRLVWSTEMALRSSSGSVGVPVAALSANPDLQVKGPLQVLDAVIAAIAQQVSVKAQTTTVGGDPSGCSPCKLGCARRYCWLLGALTGSVQVKQCAGEKSAHSDGFDDLPAVDGCWNTMSRFVSPHIADLGAVDAAAAVVLLLLLLLAGPDGHS